MLKHENQNVELRHRKLLLQQAGQRRGASRASGGDRTGSCSGGEVLAGAAQGRGGGGARPWRRLAHGHGVVAQERRHGVGSSGHMGPCYFGDTWPLVWRQGVLETTAGSWRQRHGSGSTGKTTSGGDDAQEAADEGWPRVVAVGAGRGREAKVETRAWGWDEVVCTNVDIERIARMACWAIASRKMRVVYLYCIVNFACVNPNICKIFNSPIIFLGNSDLHCTEFEK